jgi:two-component system phosphate regulon response regulator OmpR
VDVQIARLRRKIEADPSRPLHIQTVRNLGYLLRADGGA